MDYKHCCVIDETGHYKEFVMAEEQLDSASGETVLTPKHYTLSDSEHLIEANPPTFRMYAGTKGFVKPVWNGDAWEESATAEEIEKWEIEHPAPDPEPSPTPSNNLETRVAAVEHDVADLTAAVEKGLSL
jgi:hypothetical protein